jgi:hypothetical protein
MEACETRGNDRYYQAKWVGADRDREWYPASDFMYRKIK